MKEARTGTQVRAAIVGCYKKVSYCYGAPVGFLVLQLLLNTVSDFNFQPFLALFFFAFLPLSITGLVFTKRGFILASNSGDREKKDVGYANFILGAILLMLGLLSLVLINFMASNPSS